MKTNSEKEIIPIVNETASVTAKDTVKERITVRTVSEPTEQILREQLESQVVEVTRFPVSREVESAPAVRTENGVMIVPVLEERLVVQKKLFVVEELHIRTRSQMESVEVPVSVIKQRAIVDRAPVETDNEPGGDK